MKRFILLFVLFTAFVSCEAPIVGGDNGSTGNTGTSGNTGSSGSTGSNYELPDGTKDELMFVHDDGTLKVHQNTGKLMSLHIYTARDDDDTEGFSNPYPTTSIETTGTSNVNANFNASIDNNIASNMFDETAYAEYNNIYPNVASSVASNALTNNGLADVGYQVNDFTVNDGNSVRVLDARVVAKFDHAWIVLENGYNLTAEQIEAYRVGFATYYQTMVNTFGALSGDGKVVVLLANIAPLGTIGGTNTVYVATRDMSNVNNTLATIFHEYQHLIFREHGLSGGQGLAMLSVNEGFSEYARYKTTLPDELIASGTTLMSSGITHINFAPFSTNPDAYPYSFLFALYLVDRYGESAIKRLYTATGTTYDRFTNEFGVSFNEIYFDFAIALATHGRGVSNLADKHKFKSLPQNRLLSYKSKTVGVEITDDMSPYRIYYYEWQGDVDTMTVDVPNRLQGGSIKSVVFYIDK